MEPSQLQNDVMPLVAPVCAYSPEPAAPAPPFMVNTPVPVFLTVIELPEVDIDD